MLLDPRREVWPPTTTRRGFDPIREPHDERIGYVSRRIGSADDAGGMSLPHSRNHISPTTEVLSLFSSLSPSKYFRHV